MTSHRVSSKIDKWLIVKKLTKQIPLMNTNKNPKDKIIRIPVDFRIIQFTPEIKKYDNTRVLCVGGYLDNDRKITLDVCSNKH